MFLPLTEAETMPPGGSLCGAQVAAFSYPLVESAKLAGPEPKAYLGTRVLAVLSGDPFAPLDEVAELLPLLAAAAMT